MGNDWGTRIRGVITALLLGLVFWWLVVVAANLDSVPRVNAKGQVLLDEFQRSKDILLVVLPLLTTALGYWFGAAGKEKAEERAEEATRSAAEERRKLQAVLDTSPETELLNRARSAYPDAFGADGGRGK